MPRYTNTIQLFSLHYAVLAAGHIWLLCSAAPDYEWGRNPLLSHPETQLEPHQHLPCKFITVRLLLHAQCQTGSLLGSFSQAAATLITGILECAIGWPLTCMVQVFQLLYYKSLQGSLVCTAKESPVAWLNGSHLSPVCLFPIINILTILF